MKPFNQPSPAGKRFNQAGMALVVVLWMVALLTIMAGSFSLSTHRNIGLVKNAQDRAIGLALADAGVHYAMLMLSHPDPLKRMRSDGTLYEVELPGGKVRLAIYDESGKIDLNAASEQTLRTLLNQLTGDERLAGSLTAKILDWRDNDELTRLNGAEAKEYREEGKAYVPQNKNFQALEELQMVSGLTPALYKTLEPVLTIYSGQDGINPQKASGQTLQKVLGLDEKSVVDYLSQRQASPANAPPPPPTVPPGGIRMTQGGELVYTIFAQALRQDGPGAGVKAVARRQFSRNNGAPFAFVSWKQQIFGAGGALDANRPPPP